MWAVVQRDDAGLVDHLVHDRHVALRLNDAMAVAVDLRRQRTDNAEADAAVVEREILRAVERAVAVGAARRQGALALGLRRERRQLAVGRLDDQRRLPEGLVEPRAVTRE